VTNYSIPISNGIFEHRRKIGAAIWVFLWLIDHTTKEVSAEDGMVEGMVLGGQPVPLGAIAADLMLSGDAVYEHLGRLTTGGYVRKIPHGNGRPHGYAVIKSKKFMNRRTKGSGSRAETVVQNPDGTVVRNADGTVVQKPDDPRAFVREPSYKTPISYKEDSTGHYKTNDKSEDDPDDPSIAVRLLSEECGNFSMYFQGDRAKQIEAEARKRGWTGKAVADLMIDRWKFYNVSRPKLFNPFSSADKFWASGIWDDPNAWPRKDGHAPKLEASPRRYANGGPI
jgi:hypothetical protein